VRRFAYGLGRLWLVPVVLVIWQFTAPLMESPYFPTPARIATRMYELWLSGPPSHLFLTEEVGIDVVPSLIRLLGGWLGASLIGIILGIALGRSARLSGYVDPLLQFGRAIPPPTLLPVFLVLFKIGDGMQLATIVFGIIWPVLLNTIDGARYVDRLHLETARVFMLTWRQRLFRIILPEAAPKIFAGLRLSLSLALILMVVSEFIGSTNGIGYHLMNAQGDFDFPGLWADVVLLGLLGVALNGSLITVERHTLGWYHRQRQPTS
jgi:ABC-type nitrate/sulfonate/bicarbonate transport system, permease component